MDGWKDVIQKLLEFNPFIGEQIFFKKLLKNNRTILILNYLSVPVEWRISET